MQLNSFGMGRLWPQFTQVVRLLFVRLAMHRRDWISDTGNEKGINSFVLLVS